MKNNFDFIERADLYIKDELSAEDRLIFEKYCDENPNAAEEYKQHRLLFQKLREYQLRKNLKENMESVFSEQNALKSSKANEPAVFGVRSLWQKYKYTALVAASVALVAVFSTLWMSGFYDNVKESSYQYSLLKRDMNTIKKNVNAQNVAIKNINNSTVINANSHTYPEGTYGATGFALTSNGFIATNYHVVRESDSVYVQNSKGESYKAKVIYIDPLYDLAVLEIIDPSFEKTAAVPYTFKEENADLGQDVFTIGYPREDAVYGSGYLSSNTGFGGDTVSYQVTIPVNPGNSGGPVLDNKGNVIGVISGKQTETDGAAFAIKTNYLLQSIKAIPQDSLSKALVINKRNSLSGLSRTNQIKKIQDYIYIVKVF
jgi:S1-C subfamily serine protease